MELRLTILLASISIFFATTFTATAQEEVAAEGAVACEASCDKKQEGEACDKKADKKAKGKKSDKKSDKKAKGKKKAKPEAEEVSE